MIKKLSFIFFLFALGMLFGGCSNSGLSGVSMDDSNLGVSMGMGMGGESKEATEEQYSADNTPVPGPVSFEPNSLIPTAFPDPDETINRPTKANPEPDSKCAILYCHKYNIMLMNIEEGDYRSLTKDGNADVYYSSPFWAIQGKSLLFVKTSAKGSRICMINADGSNLRTLFESPDMIGSAAISPDGKRIVYYTKGSGAIWIMDINDARQQMLVEANGSDPVWSPEGNKIAFAFLNPDNKHDIYTINPNGTESKNLTSRFAVDGKQPRWSPDGKKIVFSTGHDLCVVEADGSGLTYLTNDDTKYRDNPYWLADGTGIVFEYRTKQDGDRYFCLMDLVKNSVKIFDATQSK